VDSKAECDQLNLAHVTNTNKRQCPLSSVQVTTTVSMYHISTKLRLSCVDLARCSKYLPPLPPYEFVAIMYTTLHVWFVSFRAATVNICYLVHIDRFVMA